MDMAQDNQIMLLQKFLKLKDLFHGIQEDDFLSNVFVNCKIQGAYSNVNWILFTKIMSKLLNFFWPSCTIHERLSVRSNLPTNFPNIWFETHVLRKLLNLKMR